jgi:hypothetical protein
VTNKWCEGESEGQIKPCQDVTQFLIESGTS